jgi:hypothetical protein
MITISNIDKNNYNVIRKNVSDFIKTISQNYDNENFIVLDIAPEKHLGAKEFFKFSKKMDFNNLVTVIEQTHHHFQQQAIKAVNVSLTIRNWLIGFYIVEFELNNEGVEMARGWNYIQQQEVTAAISDYLRRCFSGYLNTNIGIEEFRPLQHAV